VDDRTGFVKAVADLARDETARRTLRGAAAGAYEKYYAWPEVERRLWERIVGGCEQGGVGSVRA
jgi:hypothetical protein